MPKQQKIKLSYIAADPDLQPRAGMNLEMIEDYASDMRRGDQFPPLVVFHDGKSSYLLADGFHRLRAARAIGSKTILCEVRHGGKREALLYSVGCNAAHGQRRSNDDKRLAVSKLLKDKKWESGVTGRLRSDAMSPIRLLIICGPHWQRMPVTSAPTRPSTAPRRR